MSHPLFGAQNPPRTACGNICHSTVMRYAVPSSDQSIGGLELTRIICDLSKADAVGTYADCEAVMYQRIMSHHVPSKMNCVDMRMHPSPYPQDYWMTFNCTIGAASISVACKNRRGPANNVIIGSRVLRKTRQVGTCSGFYYFDAPIETANPTLFEVGNFRNARAFLDLNIKDDMPIFLSYLGNTKYDCGAILIDGSDPKYLIISDYGAIPAINYYQAVYFDPVIMQ